MTLTLTMIILIRIRLMGQPIPSPLHTAVAGLEMTAPCSASACPFRSEWLMAFVARSCCSCCCLVRVQAYTRTPNTPNTHSHTFFLAFSMLFCIFLFTLHHQALPESCVINLLIYILYIVYIHVLSVCCIYNFFHSCLSFCVMRFSLLRFGPHVSCLCVSLVLLKNSRLSLCAEHQRHIKVFPGIKISHEPKLTTIPPTIHPSIHPSQSSVYAASQLSISSLAFRINAWIIFCIIPIIAGISYISFLLPLPKVAYE